MHVVSVATGILCGAVLAQGASGAIWARGVPDFIWSSQRVWNVADFAIGFGMLLFLIACLAYPIAAYIRTATSRDSPA